MITEINSPALRVQIKKAGAELCSIQNKNGLEFLWQADKEVWPRHAPVLFPIVGKLKNDTFRHSEKEYKLPQHGFARDMDFELESKTDGACSFILRSNEETLKKFPFHFRLYISYSLKDNTLHCGYRVINDGRSDMYFAIGAHPGFNCPLTAQEKFEDYYLEFEKEDLVIRPLVNGLRGSENKGIIAPGRRLPLTRELFDHDALIFENRQLNSVALRSVKSDHYVICESRNWPYFGIWSKKGSDRFICLEPWWGITDALSSTGQLTEKEGMISLKEASEFTCSYSLSFQ